ncbi:SDR family NAD(P)-dependent oxidoreductase [Speluncibacter jeojiensis]|uniref:SDR family NAD(P)-dependent oxidoreductase n=1 Tax=Speluncibacter jeojiensis TaxID=2710754 RepID=UPI00240F49AA|nr:SDR family NAD(P)-dependent oxidoreductase [Rhodococcus sp. D2-41]
MVVEGRAGELPDVLESGTAQPHGRGETLELVGKDGVLLAAGLTIVVAAAANLPALDVLVNNVGINPGGAPATESDVAMFCRTYETNVFGVVAVTNAFLPLLRRSAHPRIVNVSSGTGSLTWSTFPNPQFDHHNWGNGAAYRSSKAALNALTVFYADALAGDGVKVNALAPGLRATNLTPAATHGGDPAEAAAAAVHLALLPDDGPSGSFCSWDGAVVPW